MNIITVCSLKGGVGKTTSTVFLAAAAVQLHGHRTLLVDADPQASASEWLESAPIDGVHVVETPTVCGLSKTCSAQMAQDELIIIDTPPSDSPPGIIATAFELANVVIIPIRAGGLEPARIVATIRLIPENTPYGLVLVAARRTTNTEETLAAWQAVNIPIWGSIPLHADIEAGPSAPTLNRPAIQTYAEVLDLAFDAMRELP